MSAQTNLDHKGSDHGSQRPEGVRDDLAHDELTDEQLESVVGGLDRAWPGAFDIDPVMGF
jgi:hypothetical protein